MDAGFNHLLPSSSPYYVPVTISLIAVGTYLALFVALPMILSILGLILVAYVTYQVVLVTTKKDLAFIGITFAIVSVSYQILLKLASSVINRGTARRG